MDKKISVIMGIYNCADTLEEALDSIVGQSYKNWEVILCDDCSQDGTYSVAQSYVRRYPNQFILLKNEKNMGLNYTLNKCLAAASGEYIARMDGDDRCAAQRFQKEAAILDACPEFAIVSTDMALFDEGGVWGCTHANACPEKKNFLRGTPFCHAACMVRREAYKAVGGYSVEKRLLRVEDYHLWIKMYEKGYRGCNIQEPLYEMRDDRNAQARRKFRYRLNEAYVKAYGVKHLKLPVYDYIYCLRPIVLGLVPAGVYKMLHGAKRTVNAGNK